jgi:enamine deaminase RidA (YjgF/YER057c/UK114 family)
MSDRQTKPSRGPTKLLPAGWPSPKGYANGMKARGDLIFVAGQIGWDTHCKLADGFLPQVRQALQNIVAVLAEGGAGPEHVVRLTWYVKDVPAYRRSLAELGKIYREIMGRNYPTMTLIAISDLAEPEALVEIEATAVMPD